MGCLLIIILWIYCIGVGMPGLALILTLLFGCVSTPSQMGIK